MPDIDRLPPVLTGKKALVVGVANDRSIAWGCAAAMRKAGAEIAMTYLSERAKPHVEPLALQVEAPIFMPLEVRDPAQVDALFDAVARARPTGADVPLLLVTPGAAFDAARGLPGVTVYRTTDAAIGALGRAMRYAAWRRVPADRPEVELGTRGVHARTWARSRLAARRGEPEWLAPSAQAELLAPYGIHLVGRLAGAPDEAEAVAAASRRDRSSGSPSSEPSRALLARSGCGMRPTTLRPALVMPAMSSTEPLGLSR